MPKITPRDPRENPQPGDVISRPGKRDNYLTRSVIRRRHEQVWYSSGGSDKVREIFLGNWIEWARDSEVITMGDVALAGA